MKRRSIWIWSLPVIATLLVAWHYTAPFRESWSKASERASHPGMVYVECKPFPLAKGGWGFDIASKERKIIHVAYVPYVQGWHYFVSREDALKVGDLMIQKMKKGNLFPVVTDVEMKNLGVMIK
jgi:hypothetical protein